jgi:hypothetical protein
MVPAMLENEVGHRKGIVKRIFLKGYCQNDMSGRCMTGQPPTSDLWSETWRGIRLEFYWINPQITSGKHGRFCFPNDDV